MSYSASPEADEQPFRSFAQIASQDTRHAAKATPGRALTREEKLAQRSKGKELVSLSPPPNPFDVGSPPLSRPSAAAAKAASPERRRASLETHPVVQKPPSPRPPVKLAEAPNAKGKKRKLDEEFAAIERKRAKKPATVRQPKPLSAVADAEDDIFEKGRPSKGSEHLPPPALGIVQSPKKPSTEKRAETKENVAKPPKEKAAPETAAPKAKPARKAKLQTSAESSSAAGELWNELLAFAEEASESEALMEFIRQGQQHFTLLQTLSQRRSERVIIEGRVERYRKKRADIQQRTKEQESLWQRSRLRSELLSQLNVAMGEAEDADAPTAASLHYQLKRLAKFRG